jgi:hypothetical protein
MIDEWLNVMCVDDSLETFVMFLWRGEVHVPWHRCC